MRVLRLKGNNSGNTCTSMAFEKRLEHYNSCLTTVLIVLMLHYLKLEI